LPLGDVGGDTLDSAGLARHHRIQQPCRRRARTGSSEAVPMIITLQPSVVGTSARFVHTLGQPPSLVIHDGTTTLVLRPADSTDGLVDAAGFAEALVQGASQWESGCRRTLAATQPDDPDDATQAQTAEQEHPQRR